MQGETAKLIEATNLTAPAQLLHIVGETRKYFAEFKRQAPPIPEDFLSFLPCTYLVTEVEEEFGKPIGRIQFLKEDGTAFYDATWNPGVPKL